MQAWLVYLDNKYIDTVFYTLDCNAAYVRDSLINHDNYPINIIVKRKA